MNTSEIIGRAWTEFEPELREQGYELVEAEYVLEYGRRVLRIYIDKEVSGVTLDDCALVSQILSPLLDARDFIEERFYLEVSSPGLDRPLRKPADFNRFAGEQVRITTNAPVAGRKRFHGILKGFDDGLIMVECDGQMTAIHIENLKKANLVR